MPRYRVTLPITGSITVEVEADNEDSALRAAFDSDDLCLDNIDEWEAHKHITRGNVCYASHNSYDVEEIDED